MRKKRCIMCRTQEARLDSRTCSPACNEAYHWKQHGLDRHRKRSKVAGKYRVTVADWMKILRDFNYACAYCGVKGEMTVDHVLPLSRGGRHCIANIVPACLRCNLKKGSLTVVEWRTAPKKKKKKLTPKQFSESLQWTVCDRMGVKPVRKKYKPKEAPIFGEMLLESYNRNLISGINLTVDHFGVLT